MATRDLIVDLTALLVPFPRRPDPSTADETLLDAWTEMCERVEHERSELGHQLRLIWDEAEVDPLLNLITKARTAMLDAERRMRLLIAYGREFVAPRPYTLDDLARAAGMSISGVRTAYDDDEITDVATRTGVRQRRRADGTAPALQPETRSEPAAQSRS